MHDRISKTADIKKFFRLLTSGSTGRPLDIIVTQEEHSRSKTIVFLNIYLENGCRLTDKTLRIVTPRYITKKAWFQRLGILREYFVSIFSGIDVQLNTLLQTKPQAIRGFSSAIRYLALKIKEEGTKIQPPKVIFTTAEVLSGIDRMLISSVLQAEVIDYYCCNEVGIIAYECKEHNGYHINDDNVLLEFIKQDGTPCKFGEKGEIVVTSLNRYAMPFIRYKLSDVGIPKERGCRCGRDSLLIETIMGREDDQILLTNGCVISPYLLINIVGGIAGVVQFQIVQKDLNKIIINIVKDRNPMDNSIVNRVRKECQDVLGGKIEIEPLIVDEIFRDRTGKLKVVKNEINNSLRRIG